VCLNKSRLTRVSGRSCITYEMRDVLQCVAVCCSVLQCVAVCCSVLRSCAVPVEATGHPVLVCCSVLQRCRVLPSVVCSALQ